MRQTQSDAFNNITIAEQSIITAYKAISDAELILADTRSLVNELNTAITYFNLAVEAYNRSEWGSAVANATMVITMTGDIPTQALELKSRTLFIYFIVGVTIPILLIVIGLASFFGVRQIISTYRKKRDEEFLQTKVTMPEKEESSRE